MKLENRVIAITGAASGIGRALAERFARERPKHIALIDVDSDAIAEVAASIVAASIDASAHVVDVGDAAGYTEVLGDIAERHGAIEVMVSNAGIGVGGGLETPDETWQTIWNVNVGAHLTATRAVLPAMLRAGEGILLSTASAAGLLTNIGALPYSVTKHAAVALAEWLSVSYGDRGIQVACLCPMGVETKLLEDAGPLQALLRPSAISAEEVADATTAALEAGTFLILPHPEVATYMQNRATDHQRWLAGMRALQAKLDLGPK